jgi:hypothetical protein
MRTTGAIIIALAAASVANASLGGARAEGFDLQDWYRRTEALVQSLTGPPPGIGRDIIAPPGNIDPKMAFEPPQPSGTLRIIPPPEPFARRP